MQTERKYRIDKYLEMARLTKSIDKRENFIDMANHYLESKEFDVTKDKGTDFFNDIERCEIIDSPRTTIYEKYIMFCKESGEVIQSRPVLYRQIEKMYNVISRHVRRAEGKQFYFVEN